MSLLRIILVLIALLAVWWAFEAGQQYFSLGGEVVGRVTYVRDGDTIEVSGVPIRLNGLTCDERGTPLGVQATRAMRGIVAGETLTCTLTGEQTYDRKVGRCRLADGRDIGAILIARGVCGRCDRYDPLRRYAAAQREAGPFAGSHPGYCWAPW